MGFAPVLLRHLTVPPPPREDNKTNPNGYSIPAYRRYREGDKKQNSGD